MRFYWLCFASSSFFLGNNAHSAFLCWLGSLALVAEVSNTCRIYHGSALSYYLLAVIRDNANTKAICLLTIKNSNLRNKAMQYKRATEF